MKTIKLMTLRWPSPSRTGFEQSTAISFIGLPSRTSCRASSTNHCATAKSLVTSAYSLPAGSA